MYENLENDAQNKLPKSNQKWKQKNRDNLDGEAKREFQ